jgi:hypothetical protein
MCNSHSLVGYANSEPLGEPSEVQPADAEAMQPVESIRKMGEARAKAVSE